MVQVLRERRWEGLTVNHELNRDIFFPSLPNLTENDSLLGTNSQVQREESQWQGQEEYTKFSKLENEETNGNQVSRVKMVKIKVCKRKEPIWGQPADCQPPEDTQPGGHQQVGMAGGGRWGRQVGMDTKGGEGV